MAKIKTISALTTALALAVTAIEAAVSRRDEIQAELDNAKAAADIRVGYVVTFSTGRAETRVLRFGTVKAIKDGGDAGLDLKVEVGTGFDAEYHTIGADTVFSAGPEDQQTDVFEAGSVAFSAAVARAAARAKPKAEAVAEPEVVVQA
jgi:hypothetical protein